MKKPLLFFQVAALVAFVFLQISNAQPNAIKRKDFFVGGDGRVKLFVREVSSDQTPSKVPVLLVHGARVPGVASFDLPVANGSLAEDLARAGHAVYVMDARGYGRSTRPAEMSEKPENKLPLVRSAEVVRDIAAVVREIQKRAKRQKIALFGWATGGHWSGFYATLYPETVSHLVILNSLYGGFSKHATLGPGSDMEDPNRNGQFNVKAIGAYRMNTAESLTGAWDRSIPLENKSDWRAPEIVEAYKKAALESDATAKERTPNTFRAPSGALEDSFYLASGRQLWDASLIRSRVLVVRSENDFWSRPEDLRKMAENMVYAARIATLSIPGATHFVHLDRPARGRDLLLKTTLEFLSER